MIFSITNIILGITVIVSYLSFQNEDLKHKLIFSPYDVKHHNKWWTVITHGFIHADYSHLAMNMFTLYFLGNGTEDAIMYFFEGKGVMIYLLLYLGGMLFATIPAFKKHADNPSYRAVGASGAVSAVVFGYILFFPTNILLIYGIIPIPGILLGILYLAFESYANKQGRSNIAHDAHIAGAIFGFLFLILMDFELFQMFITQIVSVFS